MSVDRPLRPDALDLKPDAIPDTLRESEQWVTWRYVFDDDRDEWKKVPIEVPASSDGRAGYGSSTDSDTWTTFDDAVEYHESDHTDTDGVGFVVHDGGIVIGVDLDDCRDPETGDLEEWAAELLEAAPTYAEVSPSGTGLRLFGLGVVPDGGNRGDIDGADGHLEMYDTGRYLTVTGHHIDETPTDVRQINATIDEIHAKYIAEDEPTAEGVADPDLSGSNTGFDVRESDGLSDEEVIERAKAAENGHKFERLWNGSTSGYPSQSEADLALCGMLAFWTGGDRQQINRLFRRSGLMRDKWDEDRGAQTYGKRTIEKALEDRTEYYDPSGSPEGTSTGAAAAWSDTGTHTPAPDGERPTWEQVRTLLESDVSGTTTQAYKAAADLLDAEYDFAVIRETDEFYYYNSDEGYYVRKGETFLQERLEEAIPGYVNNNRLRNIRDRVKGSNYVEASEFIPPRGKVCVRNGVLDLESRELEPHSPKYYFTARLQTPYDPNAEADRWPKFLAESVAGDDERKKLEEFIGYCLESWHHNREKNLFIVGPRQSGKSTFLHVLQGLLGEAPTVANLTPQQIADTQFDAASLKEAMLNAVNDINATKIEDSGTLKRIFSGERLKLERKFKDAHFGAPTAKHAFTANWLPTVVGQDESLYRRVLITEFPYRIDDDERDEQLKPKLLEELPGILNRALDARDRLHKQGGFTNDRGDTETRRAWDSWRDAHKRFLYTQFKITGDSGDTVEKETYYQAYKEFAAREGYELKPQQGVTKSLKWVPEIAVHDDTYSGLAWRDLDAAEETTQTGLPDSQKERISKVKQWVDEFSTPTAGADRDELLEYADEQGYDREHVEGTIEKLQKNGTLMEPSTGELRRMS